MGHRNRSDAEADVMLRQRRPSLQANAEHHSPEGLINNGSRKGRVVRKAQPPQIRLGLMMTLPSEYLLQDKEQSRAVVEGMELAKKRGIPLWEALRRIEGGISLREALRLTGGAAKD